MWTSCLTRWRPWTAATLVLVALAGCQALPSAPKEPVPYDLGPAPRATAPAPTPTSTQPRPVALVLADIQAPWQSEGTGTAMHYRLAYAQPQALYAYSLASWRLPPELLVQERLRQWLSQDGRTVLSAEGGRIPPQLDDGAPQPLTLQLALEEFHQTFDDATHSHAQVRLRATVTRPQPQGEVLLGQRVFVSTPAAPSADAAGGAQALTLAIDQIAAQLLPWLQQWAPAPQP